MIGTPVLRKRQPMARRNRQTDEVSSQEQARRQREAAKRWEQANKGETDLEPGLHVSSMLTTKEHVGKVAQEPHKPDEMAALGQDQSARTGVTKVSTKPRKTPGKGTTDEVVTDPPTHAGEGHTAAPPSEADKVFAAANPGKAPKQPKVGAKGKRRAHR